MKRFNRSIVLQFDSDSTGNSGALLPVTVRDSTTQLKVTLYGVNDPILANEIPNPITSDAQGNFTFFVGDGTYDVVINEGGAGTYTLLDEQIFDEDVLELPFNFIASPSQTVITIPSASFKVEVFVDVDGFQFEGAYTHVAGTDTITMSEAFVGGENVQVNFTSRISSSNPSLVIGDIGNPYLFDSIRELLNTDLTNFPFTAGQWIQTKGHAVINDGGSASYQIASSGVFDYRKVIPLKSGVVGELRSGDSKILHSGEIDVIAHRGFAGFNVEGTMYAWTSALMYGANSLEGDIQFTSDGFMVMFHDQGTMTDDMNNITGRVKDNTLAQVQAATFKQLAGNILEDKIFIPQFFEVMNLVRDNGCVFHAEIKAYRTQADIDQIVQIIVDYGLEHSVVLHSFIFTDIEYVRSLNKDIKISYLTTSYSGTDNGGTPRSVAFDLIKRDKNAMVAPSISTVDNPPVSPDPTVAEFQAAGVEVVVYTADDAQDFKFARRNNVNGIITDLPYAYNQPVRISNGTRI